VKTLEGVTVGLTGGTGTVGSSVLARLDAAGARVRILVRNRVSAPEGAESVIGSLADPSALAALARGASVLIHCAAALDDSPAECQRTNAEGARNVAEQALAAGARLVHLSTVSV
jgi:nucleoside-diphosphate-sugar epimerase